MNDAVEPDAAQGGFATFMGHLLDRSVGGLTGESGRAAAATQTFLAFSVGLSFCYSAFYFAYSGSDFLPLELFSLACMVVYVLGIVVLRTGHQIIATLLGLGLATVQVMFIVSAIGWESGVHLYLIVAGQLVYLVFAQKQHLLRWAFLALAAVAFTVCQVVLPARGTVFEIDTETLSWMFSINAVLAMSLLFTLAALSHYRARESRASAARHAERAEYLANTDELTGLSNRRPILETLERVSSRSVGNYCVAIADLDRFKDLNDAYGHSCGDAVLAVVGDRLREQIRTTDALGRWGGEEFIFVMPDTNMKSALSTMERTRVSVSSVPVNCGEHDHAVTVSVGVAPAGPGSVPHLVIKDADDALYEAKLDGRDCVRAHRGAGLPLVALAEPADPADPADPGDALAR